MSPRTEVLAIGFARALQVAIMFATYKALTQLLTQEELGAYFYFLGIAGGVGLILVNPVGVFINRFIHQWVKDRSVAKKGLFFLGFSTLAGLTASVIVIGLSKTAGLGTAIAASSLGLYVVGNTITNTFIPAINILGRAILFACLTVISQLVTVLVAMYATSNNALASTWLWSYGCTFAVFGILAYGLTCRMNDSSSHIPEGSQSQSLFKFAWPLAVSNIGLWALTQGYRPLGAWLSSLESLAIIGLGIGIASSVANAFEMLVHQIFMPKFFRSLHSNSAQERKEKWRQLWQCVVPLYLAVTCFAIGCSKILLSLLASTTYENAWIYLTIGACAEFLRMLSSTLSLVSVSELKTRATVVPYLTGGAVFFVAAMAKTPLGHSVLLGQAATLLFMLWKFQDSQWYKVSAGELRIMAASLLLVSPFFLESSGLVTKLLVLALAGLALGTILLLATRKWASR